jgi:hypothetical protein
LTLIKKYDIIYMYKKKMKGKVEWELISGFTITQNILIFVC